MRWILVFIFLYVIPLVVLFKNYKKFSRACIYACTYVVLATTIVISNMYISGIKQLENKWNKIKEEAQKNAMMYLEKVGMAPYINAKPKQLSGGQKQRVAIARALAMEPEILLFDEPTSALDPQMVGEVLEVMRTLAKDGLTMIIVTHEMAFARDVAKHVIFMGNGVIVEEGTSQQIFEDPQNEMTKEFLSRFRNA